MLKPFFMERSVLSCADSMPRSSIEKPARSIFLRTSGLRAISTLAFTPYRLRMPRAIRRSQMAATRSMSWVKLSSTKPTMSASIFSISSTTDSGDRADHARFPPQGLRLNEQNVQLNGQPREEVTVSNDSPFSPP